MTRDELNILAERAANLARVPGALTIHPTSALPAGVSSITDDDLAGVVGMAVLLGKLSKSDLILHTPEDDIKEANRWHQQTREQIIQRILVHEFKSLCTD